jgi:hypothetical protein
MIPIRITGVVRIFVAASFDKGTFLLPAVWIVRDVRSRPDIACEDY